MVTDRQAVEAMNTIIAYCKENKCTGCAIGKKCFYIHKDSYMPQNATPYDVDKQLEVMKRFRKKKGIA